jgi:hypothetical protein
MADKLTPIGLPMIKGINKKNQRMTMTKGMERIVLTYAVAGNASQVFPERRIKANTVPNTIPPIVAMMVN